MVKKGTHNYKHTWSYDVFLSFRGEDTRYTFTGNLYNALCKKKIKTFMELDRSKSGDHTSSILKALEESRIAIVVFSKGFASSTYCLDEIVEILECQKNLNQRVLPIFYDVDPSDVRCKSGGSGYQIALSKLSPDNLKKIQKWMSGLSRLAPSTRSYEEWQLQNRDKYKYEYERIDKIVEWVTSTVQRFHVFLSCPLRDTPYSFVDFLHDALEREGFEIDRRVEIFENMDQSSQSLETIDKSWLSIVVLSEKYAYSTICLDELVTILECVEKKKQVVWPIFYKVEVSDIRYQENSFGSALAKHENIGRYSKKIQKWRSALTEIANRPGYLIKTGDKNEHDHITNIVKRVSDASLSERGDCSLTEEYQQKRWRYDVFLSFHGTDTRERFTGYLYHALHRKGFKAFADEEALEKGDHVMVMTTLRNAIEESRILIVVLSENYAFSYYCVEELTMIIESKKKNNQLVIPICYGVEPSDVMRQRGSYGDAMIALKEKYGEEEVEKWSLALREIAKLDPIKIGDKHKHDDHIQSIVERVSYVLPCYDVFLSFIGKDYCSFTDFLLTALHMKGFKTFTKDKGSEDEDQIPKSLTTAIEKSRLSIIILSQNYAYSSSCLDELVTILNCMKIKRQLVWPVFYKVEPTDVRDQTNSFQKAMIEHESKFGHDKVKKWKSALSEAANLSGWHLKIGDEYEIIEEIVKKAIEI